MPTPPVTIALPIADRRVSYDFYRSGLGFTTPGEPADDGVPEPLRVNLNDGVRVMLIPSTGFGWVLGDRVQARRDHSECILSLSVATADEVDAMVDQARDAGAEIVREPAEQSWGYTATFADPDGHVWQVAVADEFLTS